MKKRIFEIRMFFTTRKNEYWMLVSSKENSVTNRSGCVGLLTSPDLMTWEVQKPLYSPNIDVGAHECPDLFKIGNWWYLIYSTYTGFYATVYRMSKSIDGPYIIPKEKLSIHVGFMQAKQ
ncbi:MAG: hypothetical protein IPJ46_11360 [Anaerolineales bacterium]|nr:hypothetical protein [Anaerolineales bacterium]